MIMISKAIKSLCPTAEFAIEDENYDTIRWFANAPVVIPTLEELTVEAERIVQVELSLEYQRKRRTEYPPVTDYLDAVVKGDQTQIQAYIDACLAVKTKYPKGE